MTDPKSTPAHAPDVTRYLREIGRRGGLKAKGRPNPASASNLDKARARLAELRSAATQAKPPGARQG